MENKRIVTVSREFGSGGRTIGKAVAEKLGVAYYDKALIKQVAEKTGFDPAYIEETGEYTKSKWALLAGQPGVSGVMGGLSAADYLWIMQRRVILDLAEREACVIVGRCADQILKDREDCVHVFVHASPSFRAERIVRLYGESEKAPEDRLREKDDRRRSNYKHYTDREWGVCQNYTLSLDSGVIGLDRCAELIVSLVRPQE